MKKAPNNTSGLEKTNFFKTDAPEERWDAVRKKYVLVSDKYSDDCSKILNDMDSSEERSNLIGYKEAIFPGAYVVDIGCGAGVDSLIIARLVGLEGKVIGVDIADKMVRHAQNQAGVLKIKNVEFRCGLMEDLPLEDCIADIVVSSGAINLSPKKEKVFSSVYRVLKGGGKFIIRDRLATKQLPAEISGNKNKWTGCIGGAITLELYLEYMKKAGFTENKVLKTEKLSNNSRTYCVHISARK